MNFLIGTDEAGYGPNLGPLTICGTLWQVPSVNIDLYNQLSEIITVGSDKLDKIRICDSKEIYKSSGTLKRLETSVLATLFGLHDEVPTNFDQLVHMISSGFGTWATPSIHSNRNQLKLPIAADVFEIRKLGYQFKTTCSNAQIRLVGVNCKAIYPTQFNQMVGEYGNKAELLSAATLGCIDELKTNLSGELKIVCDKHGGRSKYVRLTNQYLTDQFVTVLSETAKISSYNWREADLSVGIDFQARGESFLPTALASMFAKYLREISMAVWNNFWAIEVPGIRPTKGYPVDAKRFKKEIAKKQKQLGISDDSIWRLR